MARKGLPAKYAKMGFKKGWRAYKAAKRSRSAPKRTSGTKTGARTTMAKPATKVIYRTRPAMAAPKKRPRRAPRLISATTLNTIIDGTVTGATAIGTTVAVNMLPFVKDQAGLIKALIQAGGGALMMGVSRNRYMKKAGMGMIVGGAISGLLPLLPASMKVFGASRRFNRAQLATLRTGRPMRLAKPAPIPIGTNSPVLGGNSYRQRAAAR